MSIQKPLNGSIQTDRLYRILGITKENAKNSRALPARAVSPADTTKAKKPKEEAQGFNQRGGCINDLKTSAILLHRKQRKGSTGLFT